MDEIKRFIPIKELNKGFIDSLSSFQDNKESLHPIFRAIVQSEAYQKAVKTLLEDLNSDSSHFSELFLWKARAFMIEQASKGIDIDSMSEEEFLSLVMLRVSPWLVSPEFLDSLKVENDER